MKVGNAPKPRDRKYINISMLFLLSLFSILACEDEPPGTKSTTGEVTGTLSLHLENGDEEVVGFLFRVNTLNDGENLDERYVSLEDTTLPTNMVSEAGEHHYFADALFVLAPGSYLVQIVPMLDTVISSDRCTPAEATVDIIENQTTEVVLVSNCGATGNGAIDIVATLNHAPVITNLTLEPSKFIVTCEPLEATIFAEDADGDEMHYSWTIDSAPEHATHYFSYEGPTMRLVPLVAGDYEVTATVCDVFSACSALTFPVHVQQAEDGCGPPSTCRDLLRLKPCSPDGDYTLYIDGDPGSPWNCYCHDMATEPAEYLPLVHVGYDRNFSQYTAGGYSHGADVRTTYTKIRLDPELLVVDNADQTFAISHGGPLCHGGSCDGINYVTSMPYGIAMDCVAGYSQTGVGNIDLGGTPFSVIEGELFNGGWRPAGTSVADPTRQVIDLTGGGGCGWRGPGGISTPMNHRGGFFLSLAYNSELAKK